MFVYIPSIFNKKNLFDFTESFNHRFFDLFDFHKFFDADLLVVENIEHVQRWNLIQKRDVNSIEKKIQTSSPPSPAFKYLFKTAKICEFNT